MSPLPRSLVPRFGEDLHLHARPPKLLGRLLWWCTVAAWAAWTAWRAASWTARHPRTVGAIAATGGLYWLARTGYGPHLTAGVSVTAVIVDVWAVTAPHSFAHRIALPTRARARRTLYRTRWSGAMYGAGLFLARGERILTPALRRVRCTPDTDVLRVALLPGDTAEDYTRAAEPLARSFRVRDVRVRDLHDRPGELELTCLVRDPLRAPVPLPPPITDRHGLEHVQVGLREDGRPFTLPLLGGHILAGGVTGAGKGSVLWSLLAGAAPGIRDGYVKVWALDPKGGMELAGGEGLFDRFVYPERGDGAWQERMAALLEDVCTGITGRAAALRGKTRRVQGEWLDRFPLLLVVVDELSSLTGYVSDPALRRRIDNAVSFVLSQGRSVGVALIGLTQDVRVQTLGMRDLFPTRVALRHRAPDLILGEGARAEGAATDRIARRTPGVAYVRLEDEALPVRVRFAHVTDTDIARLVRTYGQPTVAQPVPAGLGG